MPQDLTKYELNIGGTAGESSQGAKKDGLKWWKENSKTPRGRTLGASIGGRGREQRLSLEGCTQHYDHLLPERTLYG